MQWCAPLKCRNKLGFDRARWRKPQVKGSFGFTASESREVRGARARVVSYRTRQQQQPIFRRLLVCDIFKPSLHLRPLVPHRRPQPGNISVERLMKDCYQQKAGYLEARCRFGKLLEDEDVGIRVASSEFQKFSEFVDDEENPLGPAGSLQGFARLNDPFNHF